MDTNGLQAFLAVAKKGSFSLAAGELFLTQPAVSKRIAALEEELATQLFERLGRRIILTQAGKALLPKVQHILQEMDASRRLIADLSTEVTGRFSIATSHHIGLHRLPPILRAYNQHYPQVELDLHFMDSEQGCSLVATGDVELAVVTLPETPVTKLVMQPVWEDPLVAMVSAGHALAASDDILPDLYTLPLIVPEKGTETRRLIEQPFVQRGITLCIGIETNALETIRMLVAVGLGWSVLPLSMHNHDLVCLNIPGMRFHRRLGLVCHANRAYSRAATVFMDVVRQSAKPACE